MKKQVRHRAIVWPEMETETHIHRHYKAYGLLVWNKYEYSLRTVTFLRFDTGMCHDNGNPTHVRNVDANMPTTARMLVARMLRCSSGNMCLWNVQLCIDSGALSSPERCSACGSRETILLPELYLSAYHTGVTTRRNGNSSLSGKDLICNEGTCSHRANEKTIRALHMTPSVDKGANGACKAIECVLEVLLQATLAFSATNAPTCG